MTKSFKIGPVTIIAHSAQYIAYYFIPREISSTKQPAYETGTAKQDHVRSRSLPNRIQKVTGHKIRSDDAVHADDT